MTSTTAFTGVLPPRPGGVVRQETLECIRMMLDATARLVQENVRCIERGDLAEADQSMRLWRCAAHLKQVAGNLENTLIDVVDRALLEASAARLRHVASEEVLL